MDPELLVIRLFFWTLVVDPIGCSEGTISLSKLKREEGQLPVVLPPHTTATTEVQT